MGLEKQEGRRTFLNVSDGKIVRQHQNPIEGTTVTRTNKNNRVVHEEFFSRVTGLVTDVKSKETPFGMVWEVFLQDGDEDFVLSFNYSSKYANHFFRAAPNVDFTAPITVNPWSMKDKKDPSKQAIGLSLYQDQGGDKKTKIEFAYSKDNPGEMPELEQKKVKGKTVWDDSKQLDFFETLIRSVILPQIHGVKKSAPATKAQPVAAEVDDDEDAPF
jgi:hypothetical protein